MAKPKIPSIKQDKVSGYGLKAPWSFVPSDADTRGTSSPSAGAGDYYGTGVRNPIGRSRDITGINPVSKDKLQVAPKSLA